MARCSSALWTFVAGRRFGIRVNLQAYPMPSARHLQGRTGNYVRMEQWDVAAKLYNRAGDGPNQQRCQAELAEKQGDFALRSRP